METEALERLYGMALRSIITSCTKHGGHIENFDIDRVIKKLEELRTIQNKLKGIV